jgi:hypothetical protein
MDLIATDQDGSNLQQLLLKPGTLGADLAQQSRE